MSMLCFVISKSVNRKGLKSNIMVHYTFALSENPIRGIDLQRHC